MSSENDKVRKQVASSLRRWADGCLSSVSGGNVALDPFYAKRVADLLDPPSPPPEPEKPMRWWAPKDWQERGTVCTVWRAATCDVSGVEVCIHPADASHCDKAEHVKLDEAALDLKIELHKATQPRCNVEGHADLERQANDFGMEVERLRKDKAFLETMWEENLCRVSELEAQLTAMTDGERVAREAYNDAADELIALTSKITDFARENRSYREHATERDALLREVVKEYHERMCFRGYSGIRITADTCRAAFCSRVRAALGGQ